MLVNNSRLFSALNTYTWVMNYKSIILLLNLHCTLLLALGILCGGLFTGTAIFFSEVIVFSFDK